MDKPKASTIRTEANKTNMDLAHEVIAETVRHKGVRDISSESDRTQPGRVMRYAVIRGWHKVDGWTLVSVPVSVPTSIAGMTENVGYRVRDQWRPYEDAVLKRAADIVEQPTLLGWFAAIVGTQAVELPIEKKEK